MDIYSFIFLLFILFIFIYIYFSNYKTKESYSKLKYKKSQFNQDLSLYYHYFQKLKNGVFIEIGAHDGLSLSNSYFFEKNFNWHGILIEGGEENCKKLLSNHIHRKNSIMICSPVCKTKFVRFKERGFVGKVDHNNSTDKIQKCNTLKNITNIYNIKHIDLFSLDVEGSELEVLETFDFNVNVSYWLIEWNHLSKNVKESIEKMLNKHGYIAQNIFISPIDKLFSKKKQNTMLFN